MDIKLGQIVCSKAGRDKGKKFVVIEIIDNNFVMVADGNLRRLERPKKKRIKHLDLTEQVIEQLEFKLQNKLKVSNSELRKALAAAEGTMQA
ncbi:MAG: KOW domain-containing RNA-binding protein [Clostridia bacterium]|nr:KOW domain-containing RNA-binding protein [Clostridia bacterium]